MSDISVVPSIAPDVSVDTGADVSSDVASELDSGSEVESSTSTKDESFSDWLKRHNSEKGAKAKEPAKTEKAPTKIPPEDATVAAELKDLNADAPKDLKDLKDAKAPAEQTIKVGDKEYKSQDVEQMTAEITKYKNQEAVTTQQLGDLVNTLRTNPGKILDKLEVSRDIIEKYYFEKYLEQDTLTAEQKLERYQKADQERQMAEQQRIQAEQQKAQEDRNRAYWSEHIKTALTGEGLPETPWTINRMAGYIKNAKDQGINVPSSELAKLVKQDIVEAQKAALQGLNPEQLVQALGQEGVAKLRQHDTEKFKQTKFENRNPGKSRVEKPKPPGKKYRSPYDILDDL